MRYRFNETMRYLDQFLLTLGTGLLLASAAFAQEPSREVDNRVLEPVIGKKDLYPAGVNAANEIKRALKSSALAKKRVLLVFGANWCYDCHVLDRALHEGAAGAIVKESFAVVHVDIGEGEKNVELIKKYRIPLEKGVPAVVILGSNGNLLYSSAAGEFEAARSMMKKDLVKFLVRWKEKARKRAGH